MFKKGDKVVCVKPDEDEDGDLVKYKMYIVIAVRPETGGIKVSGTKCTGNNSGYFRPDRFRKVDESFAENILENTKEQIKEEQLELV